MILLTYQTPEGLALGIKTDQGILDVAAAKKAMGLMDLPATPNEVLTVGRASVAGLEALVERASGRPDLFREEGELRLGPCVPNPGKVICVGLNYRRHVEESNMAAPDSPILFSKFNNSIAAPNEPIPLPAKAIQYDYEAELAVVIGQRAKEVSEEQALSHVLGYCNVNDLSARDLQFRTNQWLLGKTLDKFLPIGPYLVTADEAGDPLEMPVRCWVNGELRQNSNTADMLFSVAYLVHYISQYMTLEPGDVIATGTPEGVVFGMKEKVWLKSGDEVTIEIGKLGRLTNVMSR